MTGAVFLASGKSARFGEEDKLLYRVEGIPMAERVFRALPPEISGVVVTESAEVAALAKKHKNLTVIPNPGGAEDVSVTIRRGVESLPPEADGALFFVCDQPHLTQESVRRIISAFEKDPSYIYVPSAAGRSGNPCLFPRAFFPALCALPFDRGGKELVRQNPAAVRYVELDNPRELEDMDYKPRR